MHNCRSTLADARVCSRRAPRITGRGKRQAISGRQESAVSPVARGQTQPRSQNLYPASLAVPGPSLARELLPVRLAGLARLWIGNSADLLKLPSCGSAPTGIGFAPSFALAGS